MVQFVFRLNSLRVQNYQSRLIVQKVTYQGQPNLAVQNLLFFRVNLATWFQRCQKNLETLFVCIMAYLVLQEGLVEIESLCRERIFGIRERKFFYQFLNQMTRLLIFKKYREHLVDLVRNYVPFRILSLVSLHLLFSLFLESHFLYFLLLTSFTALLLWCFPFLSILVIRNRFLSADRF